MTHPSWLQAFVLHRRAYRETSYLIDFFTLEAGKVSAVAKGVRSVKSDRKSLLQPFQSLRIQLRGKTDLKNLTQVESLTPAIALTGNALFCGMYVNELTNRIMPAGLESEVMFTAYTKALQNLAYQNDKELALRTFEFALLEEMGLMPEWGIEARTQTPVIANQWYRYASDEGMVAAIESEPGSIRGDILLALAQGEWHGDSQRAAKKLSRQILLPLLGARPLKSRELFVATRRKP
ncbi:DNA repair protein RecO [Alteromonas halophila]|uniref:DNA repair protein RecO n=1 Tax=Alteromonas halophila TaxID=516698 RepID=A0A918MX97_9ALTE|nr:DNA repair protein RecO [Alteromonas halophila]GGW80823.1 DNA repair protein RecO [Alteromonas halophila]